MSILKRLQGDTNGGGNGKKRDDEPLLLYRRPGRRRFSWAGLRERIERQFELETYNRPDILCAPEDERRLVLLETLNHVLAVEGIALARRDKHLLLDEVYAALFGFGPLEPFIRDESVTEILVDGPDAVSIRYGAGPLRQVDARFEGPPHLEGLIRRALNTQGVLFDEETPFIEIGLEMLGRPMRLSLIGPPVSPRLHLEIRLHPPEPIPLEAMLPGRGGEDAVALLGKALKSGRGLLIAGEAGSGKTTLLASLARLLPDLRESIAVERAREMRLPDHIGRLVAGPPGAEGGAVPFEERIRQALANGPDVLLLDEVRGGDEARVLWPVLKADAPQLLCAFRCAPGAERIRTVLGMWIRRAEPSVAQAEIGARLARRLPIVACVGIRAGRPTLVSISELVASDEQLELKPLWDS